MDEEFLEIEGLDVIAHVTSDIPNPKTAEQIDLMDLDDNTAVQMIEMYPLWESGNDYPIGYKVQRNDRLWKCLQAHRSQDGWIPEAAPALWCEINETRDGTIDDPIPYDGNMTLVEGLYYMQDGEIYICKYGSGIAVYAPLSELTTFVEKV